MTAGLAGGQEGGGPAQVERSVGEYLALLAHDGGPDRVGLGLAQTGLALSHELAVENTGRIAAAAGRRDRDVVLGADRAPAVDTVLSVHRELAGWYGNLGVTVHAQLHRTEHDLAELARPGRPIRLVRGDFREPAGIALNPGPALDDRYLQPAETLVEHGARLSPATRDPAVLATAKETGLLARVADIEMPHGVRPQLEAGGGERRRTRPASRPVAHRPRRERRRHACRGDQPRAGALPWWTAQERPDRRRGRGHRRLPACRETDGMSSPRITPQHWLLWTNGV